MSYLLDVNVLIALLDQDHVFHERAEIWFEARMSEGWATCPITENGVLRIFGSPRYPQGPGLPRIAAAMIRELREFGVHEFWTDDLSMVSSAHVDISALGSAVHITDTYLLALAVSHKGKLATFDRRLSPDAVKGGADALHLFD